MRFKPRPKGLVTVGIVLLVVATGLASGVAVRHLPDVSGTSLSLIGPALLAILAVILIWRGMRGLSVGRQATQFVEVPAGVPRDMERLSEQLLQLDSRIEHAPIALFKIDATLHDPVAEPLNISARRLFAPGRIADKSDFSKKLAMLTAGQRNIVEFESERGRERSLATVSAVTVEGFLQRLIAVMPVESELEAEAMQAWQQLIRVLTHEIMNSLTPVASLSQTSRDLLQDLSGAASDDSKRDLLLALDAIYRRADGLIHFVDGYRSLASVPEARIERVSLKALFARLSTLIGPSWHARGGVATFSVEPETVELMIDSGQLEQAFVNLMKNAAEATSERDTPEVSVNARLTHSSRLRIEIRDNGPGVPDDAIPHIFTPFFTTKRKGSGIGLAMVRQLVHRNGGTVRYVKLVGGGACFVLTF